MMKVIYSDLGHQGFKRQQLEALRVILVQLLHQLLQLFLGLVLVAQLLLDSLQIMDPKNETEFFTIDLCMLGVARSTKVEPSTK
jgi:hypothetical protein